MTAVRTIVGVPGRWRDEEELARALGDVGVLLDGDRITDRAGSFAGLELELYPFDPTLERAFGLAGAYSSIGKGDLRRIGRHRRCVYVLLESEDGRRDVGQVVLAASKLLDAGGIAVKVESAGRSHTAEEWRRVDPDDTVQLVDTFVAWVGGRGQRSYSCGMHNLGFRDVTVPAALDPQQAFLTLRTFCCYLAVDRPEIHDKDTMALLEGGPTFRIRDDESEWEEGHPFRNPFGVWSLWLVDP